MRPLMLALAAALISTPVAAQVEVQPLAAPDYFSLGDREAGLSQDLWRGSSPAVAQAVIPVLASKPLSPAATALARRVLATGANGPGEAGRDPALAAARVQALLALGRPRAGWAAVERAPGLPTSPALSQAAADAALLAGDDDAACRISDQLTAERGEVYWLRLRAYCQARAGQVDAAQLTLTLASEKARDPIVSRLIGAVIAGAGDPGAASLRSPLEYALSKRLALDLTPALKGAAPAVLAAIEAPAADTPVDPSRLAARLAATQGVVAEVDALFVQTTVSDAKAAARWQSGALIASALGAPLTEGQRAALAGFAIPAGSVSPGRLAALDLAAAAGLKGEAALHVLAISAEAGGKPLKAADSARVVAALIKVGLTEDAVRFADEALTALQVQ